MRKAIAFALSAAVIAGLPSAAHAAWWNPSQWFKRVASTASTTASVSTDADATATDSVAVSAEPTVADLYKRIAELENKLQEAQAALSAAGKVVEESTAQAKDAQAKIAQAAQAAKAQADKIAAATPVPLDSAIAKAKPAIVMVEASTTGAGIVIDAQGDVLVAAHTVWKTEAGVGVMGAANAVTVTLATGAKKQATLVGIDEAADLAIYKISDKGSYPYVKTTTLSGQALGVRVAVFGLNKTVVEGTIVKKSAANAPISADAEFDKQPAIDGGIAVNADGAVVGLSGSSSCKILEEMSNCLRYTAHLRPAPLTKLLQGMRLYKDKKDHTKVEELVRGKIDGVYKSTNSATLIDYAISSVSGGSSFDNFNAKLGQDQDGKITKLYLQKLKSSAEIIGTAMDFLKDQADGLNIFFVNEEANILTMDDYQRAVLAKIQSDNKAKVSEYQKQVALWSQKKNEYDGYLADPSRSTHDFLLEEGVFVEDAATYLTKEKKWVLDTFSGENAAIF